VIELTMLALIAIPFAVASVLLLMLLIDVLVRRADVTAALVIGSTLVDAFFADAVPSLTLPGDMRLGSTDIVATLVLCAAFARLLRTRRFSVFQRWLIFLVILLIFSLARGIIAFGIQTSLSDFRLMEFWIAAAVYFATVHPSPLVYDRIAKLWVWMTVPIMAIVVARWLSVFAGIDVGVPGERFGADATIRVLNGPYTFFLAQGFILTLPFWRQDRRERPIRIVSVLLLLFVVLLDRRTAWVALLAGIVTLIFHDRRLGRRAVLAVLTTFGVVIGAYYTVQTAVTSGDPIAQADNTGSVAWRVEGWVVLISQWAKSSMNWFTGEPFGTGFLRVVEGSNVVAGPHNFYVEMLLRTGIAGLLALFALTAGLLIATWRKSMPDAGVFGSGVLAALLMMQLVWFVTWTPGIEQGIVTGIAISLAAYAAEKTPPSQPRERSLDSRSAG